MFKQKINLLSVLFFFIIAFSLYYQSTNKKKPVRVYANMVADLFHPGHVEFLKKAKAFGDVLIVGLISDEDAASYKRQPIMTLAERTAAVQACRLVDEVIPGSPMITTKEFMEKHTIDIVVHGDDHSVQQHNTYHGDALKMGKFKTVPYQSSNTTPGISTSQLIKRIKSRENL